ncbi:MAG TPA: sugar ABC transporter substrate-binding protein [Candidatus Methylomirabilis sp.]|nr:sugar ABC transporter substrate-binding protein [Candidatus Methylomirabilis sp.]
MNRISRRHFLSAVTGLGGLAVVQGLTGPRRGAAAEARLEPYLKAKINWRQVAGESITVLVTPAHYFNKFRAFAPEFTQLSGVEVKFEIIPPRENREKAVLDLGAKSGNYASHTADPMFLPLYVANKWVEPLDNFINDPALTDKQWFDLDDIVPLWRQADQVGGKLYGMPVEGEATIHIYRADIYKRLGLNPPETLEELRETARKAHTPAEKLAGVALRGFRGAGQNMYIWPSLFRAYGGEWFDSAGRPTVNSDAGVGALEFYVDVLRKYAPAGVENWNWPEIMEAFAQGNVVQYIDANSTASILENPAKSKVAGKVAYRRWPKGPSGKRVTSIWNWAMPINAALNDRKKKAIWLYIQWLASRETQMRTATFKESPDAVVRTGVNRVSLWNDPQYRKVIGFTPDYADVVLRSMREDTDVNWRPLVPQWPEIGEIMAVAIQAALVGQKTPKRALDDANAEIAKVMKG